MVALSELVDFKGGGTPSKAVEEYWGGDIPWASVKDFKSSEINETVDHITVGGLRNSASNLIPAGNIIIPTRMALGKVAINTVDVAINQDLRALIVKDVNVVNKRYLLRFMESKASYLESEGKGATVKGITLDVLKPLEIFLPPLSEQKRIAAILDKADNLRRKRQQAIQLADQFLRSVFLDIYEKSSDAFKEYPFLDLAKKERNSFVNGPFGSNLLTRELQGSGVPVVYIRDIREGEYKRVSTAYITNEKFNELNVCSVMPDDVLIAKVGDPPGTSALYPNNEPPAIVTQDVIRIRCDNQIVMPSFLVAYLNSHHGSKVVDRIKVEATRSRIGLGDLKKEMIHLPPIHIQKKFDKLMHSFSQNIEKQRRSSFSSDELFKSLSQKAFAGKL